MLSFDKSRIKLIKSLTLVILCGIRKYESDTLTHTQISLKNYEFFMFETLHCVLAPVYIYANICKKHCNLLPFSCSL